MSVLSPSATSAKVSPVAGFGEVKVLPELGVNELTVDEKLITTRRGLDWLR